MLLQMKNICKDYPQGKDVIHILKNISLEIQEGDYLAIMGPSGSRQDHSHEPDRMP